MILNGWPRRSFRAPSLERRRRKPRRMVVGWWFEVLPKTLKLEGTRKRSLDFFRGSDDFIPPAFPGASRRRRGIGVESKRFNIIRHPIKPLILTADRGMTPVSHWYPQSCDERGWAGYQDKQIFGTVGHMKSWMVLMHLAFRFLWPLRGGMVLSCLHPWIF